MSEMQGISEHTRKSKIYDESLIFDMAEQQYQALDMRSVLNLL